MSTKEFILKLVYFFIGNRCIGCGLGSFFMLCKDCHVSQNSLIYLNSNAKRVCVKCACYILTDIQSHTCQSCIIESNIFFRHIIKTRSLFLYNDFLAKLIHDYKYSDKLYIGKFLSSAIRDDLVKFVKTNQIHYILPVPLSSAKLSLRMFNQISIILINLKNYLMEVKVLNDAVIKTKDTASQASLDYEARKQKKHHFVFNEKYKTTIESKNLLIFDDIITTGSTVGEMATLLKSVCANVYVYSVGRVVLNQ